MPAIGGQARPFLAMTHFSVVSFFGKSLTIERIVAKCAPMTQEIMCSKNAQFNSMESPLIHLADPVVKDLISNKLYTK